MDFLAFVMKSNTFLIIVDENGKNGEIMIILMVGTTAKMDVIN